MKWSLLTVLLCCWSLFFLGLLLVLFVSTWLEGPESIRVAAFAAPFWAATLCVRARISFWQNLKLDKAELERQIPCFSNPEPSPSGTATAKDELNPAHVLALAGLALIGGILLMVIGMSQMGQSGSLLWALGIALSFLGGLMMFVGAMFLAFIALDRVKSPVMIKAQWGNLDQLCAHLRQMGLDATVESQKEEGVAFSGGTIGTIRIANRHIDVVEFARAGIIRTGESEGGPASEFWCTYVVRAKVEGWEDGVIAEGKPVRKSILSRQVVDYHWEGACANLAQTLNNDYDLRNSFISLRNPPSVRISKGPLDIRIFDKGRRPDSPEEAFPTIEIFNAYDKIAQHIRNIACA